MLFPYADNNPTSRTPVVNNLLIVSNIAVYLLVNFRPDAVQVILAHAIDPSRIQFADLFTYMFLHSGFLHLAGNVLFLHIYGDNVEDKLGHALYAFFYLVAGLVAAAFHLATDTMPCVGASGAIAGVMGAYVVLFPAAKVKFIFILFPPIYKKFELYSWFALGGWFAGQLLSHLGGEEAGVAFTAHIGGFITGAIAMGALILVNFVEPELSDPGRRKTPGRANFHPPPVQDEDLDEMFQAAKEDGLPCPSCLKAMPFTDLDGRKLEQCFECGGLWVSKEEAEHLLRRPQMPYSLLKPPARDPKAMRRPHGQRYCSHCEVPLRSVDMEGVKIEGCDHCRGMWFERGDLASLRERLGLDGQAS